MVLWKVEHGRVNYSIQRIRYHVGYIKTFDVIFVHGERPNCLLYQLTEVYPCQSGNPLNYFDLSHNKYELDKEETIMHTAGEATFKCYLKKPTIPL